MGLDLGRFIRDRKRDIRDVFDANTQQDQQRRVAQGQPRMYADQRAQQRPAPTQYGRPQQFQPPQQQQRPTAPIRVDQPDISAPTDLLREQAQVRVDQPGQDLLDKYTDISKGVANTLTAIPRNNIRDAQSWIKDPVGTAKRVQAGGQLAADQTVPNQVINRVKAVGQNIRNSRDISKAEQDINRQLSESSGGQYNNLQDTIKDLSQQRSQLTPEGQKYLQNLLEANKDIMGAKQQGMDNMNKLSSARGIVEDLVPGGAMGADLIREVGPRGAARILESASKNKVTSTIPNVKGAAETVRNIQKTGVGKFIFGDKPIETAEKDLQNMVGNVPVLKDVAKFGPLATVAGVALNVPGVGGLDDAGKAAKVIAGTDNLDDIAKVVVNTPDLEKAIANLDDAKKAKVLEDLAKETDPKNVQKIVQEAAQDTGKPKVAFKQPEVEKYGWKSQETSGGTQLYNRDGKHVATISPAKNGRFTATYPDGTRIASGGNPVQLADDVAKKHFYAQETPVATPGAGGTLRPDKAPEPYKNNVWQGEISPERLKSTQANVDDMKASLAFDKQPTPKKAYHSTGSLDIEDGRLRASPDGVMGDGVYLHTNPDTARYAGAMQADGNILDQNALDVALKTDNLYKWAGQDYPTPEQVALIKKRGYDGIYKKDGELVIFDPSKIEVASQAPKLEKLTPEARANQGVPEVDEAFRVDAGTPNPTAGADSPIVMSGGGRSNIPETVKPARTDVEPKKVGLATEVKRAMSDKDQVILSELRSIEKQTGQKGLVDKFMYNSNMQRGSNATANQVLATSENVSSAIGDLSKSDYRAFSDYANARTELSRATKDTPLSRSRGELEQLVKGANPDQIARFQALNNHYKELAVEAYKAGLITKERLAAYAANDDYVRLQRDMDDLVSAGSQGKGNSYSLGSTILDQKRKGSSRATLGAGETAAEYTQDVYKEIARNRTATQLADVLTESGLARKVDSATNKNVINVRRNGVTEHYEVSGEIKQAVDNINPYHMNVVMKILAAPGRVMRAGITGLNPVFIARNLLKDQIGSAINSDSIMATHNPKSFFSGLLNASSDAVGANNSALYTDFLKHYGDQTSFDLTRNAKEAGQVVNRIRGGKAVGIGQGVKAPIRSLENFASITEKSTRFQNYAGEYKKAIKAGLEPAEASEKAAIAAWQNSVDFSRAGTWGRAINTVIPYWNPATQGVRQMGRTFTKHPVKSGFTATALVGVPLATATAWNLSSPETAEVYANIPEYEKENNIILIPPGTKQNDDGSYDIIKIPLTPGYKDAFMPIRRALEAYHGDKPLEAGQLAQDLLQTITGPVSTQSAGAFAGSFIPQAAKPIAQWGMNQDFFTGKKTVPDYVNEATDAQGNPIPENKKAYEYTSGLARGIGNLTNSSPMKVEKAVKDVGGTVGLNLLNAADRVLAKTGKIPEEQIGGQSVAEGFKRSFGQAQGIDNANKSAGAKYFETVSRLQGEVKLTNAEKNAWDALHPGKKNFLGDTVYEADSTYNPAARLDTYNRFPKTFELDKRLDAENRKAGKPGNPMYDLQPWQVKKVLEKDNLPPGADDPELSKLREKDWYADYSTKKSKFFTDLTAQAKKEGREFGDSSNPYPTTPPDLQKIMDSYSALPKGTGERSSWIKSNPGQWKRMQDQFAKMDNWQNIARGERGLDATEGDTGIAAGYGDSSGSSYGSGYGKGGSGGSKSVGDPYKYAISPNAGGGKKLNTSVSVKTPDKSKVAAKKVSKPKVTLKKARV